MKKLILAMVFVFATGTIMNANSTSEIIITPTTEAIEILEDFGCARDCVDSAFEQTIEEAEEEGELVYMEDYLANYELCYTSNC